MGTREAWHAEHDFPTRFLGLNSFDMVKSRRRLNRLGIPSVWECTAFPKRSMAGPG